MQLKIARILVVFVFTILVSACASVKKTAAINALVPTDGFTKQAFRYGPHADQTFDLYRPKRASTKPPIVYVYGSAWRKKFNKSDFLFVAQALTSLGHPVILPEHRRFPEVKFPGFVEDIADAVAYACLLYTSPSPRDKRQSRMPSSA